MKKLTTFAVLAALAALAGTPARADSTSDVRSETVKFADLNTRTPSGAAALYQRLSFAAESVCRDLDSRQLALMQAHEACVHRALADAVAAIDVPAVTAYAAARGMSASGGIVRIASTK